MAFNISLPEWRTFVTAICVLMLGLIVRFFANFYHARTLIGDLPSPPHSKLWGSLESFGTVRAKLPADIHPHTMLHYLTKEYDLPPVYYLDTYPFGWPICIVLDPDAAQHVMAQISLPKHQSLRRVVRPLAGENSLVTLEGAAHKKWRAIFNPGFSSGHIMTLVDGIVDDALRFIDVLDGYAESGEIFSLEEAATSVTVDIIGRAVLDVSMDAHTSKNPFVKAFRSTNYLLGSRNSLNLFKRYSPMRFYTYWYNRRVMDQFLSKIIDKRLASRSNDNGLKSHGRHRPVIDLAFDAFAKDFDTSKGLTSKFRKSVLDHLKILMFAGHDTSSSVICYVAYELSKHPEELAKLREEFDDVLGPDATQTAAKIKADPRIIYKLPYTLAVIKETLRLWPPASSVRQGQPGVYIHKNGKQYPTEGFMVWTVVHAMHLSPNLWSKPLKFKPERWLMSEDDPEYPIKGAWRPFEHGPRNCIGQELAMIEIRIIVVLMLRNFNICAVYDEWDKINNTQGITKTPEGERAYQVLLATSKPVHGMPAKAKRYKQR